MSQPKRWMQSAEVVMTLAAFLIVAIAFVISRLFGS
jgi:hypothetical protein